MNISTKTYQEVIEGLKEIIFSNICKETKRKTLEILLKLTNANILEPVKVLNFEIDALCYENVLSYMKNEQKIKAIQEIRKQYKEQYKGDTKMSLIAAKEIVEEISYIEKIPMTNGYQE